MSLFQLPRFMNDTRSWRTPLVPYQKNTKLTIPSWFWLPPVLLVFLFAQFCSFYHITASTDSSIPSKIFWVVPKRVKILVLSLNLFYFHSFCVAVQIKMPKLWTCGIKNPAIKSPTNLTQCNVVSYSFITVFKSMPSMHNFHSNIVYFLYQK